MADKTKQIVLLDTECHPNFWLINLWNLTTGVRVSLEMSDRCDLDAERLRKIMYCEHFTFISFNGMSYDMPMIFKALTGVGNIELKRANDLIIKSGLKYWESEKALGIKIPYIDHIDLIEPNPSVRESQKTLAGRLHAPKMQDLPYDPDHSLTHEQMDQTIAYCWNDIEVLKLLYDALQEPLALREALGKEYRRDFRSKSDSQMGSAIIISEVEKISGLKIKRGEVKPKKSFMYTVPDWMYFETEQLKSLLSEIENTVFYLGADGKTIPPPNLDKRKLHIGSSTYTFGIGGIHSTEKSRSLHSDAENILVDADVTSQYPNIIMRVQMSPCNIGPHYLTVCQSLIDRRVRAKASGDYVTAEGGKIALNGGAYGNLGSVYSPLFDPHVLISCTLTGQLSILMLIERCEKIGFPVVSGNTDGVLFFCPRERRLELDEVIKAWESETKFTMETTEYVSIYNSSVNYYFAVKTDGKMKIKGPRGNPWRDGNLRGQMMKNPQMTILTDAVADFLTKGVPVEDTIRGCQDVRGFVTVTKVTGGSTWRGDYLGKVVRFIWSIDGDPILRAVGHHKTGTHGKVPNTDGCRPMMELPEHFPDDIDYDRYIAEAYAILNDIGWVDPNYVEPVKPLVFKTPRKRLAYLLAAA